MMTLVKNKYAPLTEKTAAELAVSLGQFPGNASLATEEIGDGNLNLVFRIKENGTGKSLIIKQALPFAKVVGESWPLTLKRAAIEAEALKLFKKLAPDFVPEVFYNDEELAVTVMEDLSHLEISRTGLISGKEYPLLSGHLGNYLARTLFYTSDYGLLQADKKKLAKDFYNPELCKITEDLIFADPYFNSPTNDFEEELKGDAEALWADSALKLEAARLRKIFLNEAEALLHGDLHTGSIFASDAETKVIDPEFAFYGPGGFDIGQVIANLLFQSIANPEKTRLIDHHIETFWGTFSDDFSLLWQKDNKDPFAGTEGFLSAVLQKYWEDAVGFAGCELIRRTIGLAHVADLDGIEDKKARLAAKRAALAAGRNLILQRREIADAKDLCRIVSLVSAG
ncbi:S-methyl-5-thioribose kinase [Bacillus infantis]|uniref:S-methyl-5-thioribose kinase n=1 Tax=Bacillus infantis TaxID=324767 RepID=UPI003CED9A0C